MRGNIDWRLVLVGLSLLVVAGLLLGVGVGSVSAQEAGSDTDTPTEEETAQDGSDDSDSGENSDSSGEESSDSDGQGESDSESDSEEEQRSAEIDVQEEDHDVTTIAHDISPTLNVNEVTYDKENNRIYLRVTAERTHTVSFVDMSAMSRWGGSDRFSFQTVRVPRGQSVVVIDTISNPDDLGVASDGAGKVIKPPGIDLLDDAAQWVYNAHTGATIIVMTVLMFLREIARRRHRDKRVIRSLMKEQVQQ